MTASRLSVRVYYEDTDAGGIVYHAAYLHYAERGRTEFIRELGIDQQKLREESGLGFVVANLSIDYAKPGLLDDLLTVETEAASVARASASFLQTIRRGDETLAVLRVRVACLDRRGRPARLPDALRQATKGQTAS